MEEEQYREKEGQVDKQEAENLEQQTQAKEIMNPQAYMVGITQETFEDMDDEALEEFKNGIPSATCTMYTRD